MNASDGHSYDEEHERTKDSCEHFFPDFVLLYVRGVTLSCAHYQRPCHYRPLNPKILPYRRDNRSTISA